MWHYIPGRRLAAPVLLTLLHLVAFAALEDLLEVQNLQSANVPTQCGLQPLSDKLVVAARYKENVAWMQLHLDAPYLVYQAEKRGSSRSSPHTHSNVAREASAFLMFIAEYYDCLPEVVAFIHGHRSSWHIADIASDLRLLNWEKVAGYMPLSRLFFEPFGPWFWTFPTEPERHLETPIATGEAATNGTFPKNDIYNGTVYEHDNTFRWQQARDVATAWKEFFGPAGLGPMPAEIRYFCCAQFVARKENIRRQPREFYLQAIHWLETSPWKGAINPQYSRGLVFETMWHVIMGEPHIGEGPQRKECEVYACKMTQEQERVAKLEAEAAKSAHAGKLVHSRGRTR